MKNSDVNPDSSSGSTDGGQSDDQPATLAPEEIADALAESGANAGQHGHEMSVRGDALYEQCQGVAAALRADPENLSREELDTLAAEAIEAVGDIEAWSTQLFEILSKVEEARAHADGDCVSE
jgi:L-lactate utilization protein LutC